MRMIGHRTEHGAAVPGIRPELSEARERHLLAMARASHDRNTRDAARTLLWQSHAHLVMAAVRRHRGTEVEPAALMSAGYLGLHEAIEGFHPEHPGDRLALHAIACIRRRVEEHIDRQGTADERPAALARRQAARLGPWLLAWARRECAREGVAATEAGLFLRVGRRLGLSGTTVARLMTVLSASAREIPSAAPSAAPAVDSTEEAVSGASIARLDHIRARRRLTARANALLGHREKVVFLARCPCVTDAPVPAARLAAALGVTPARIAVLETSARRKMTIAALVEEAADPPGQSAMPVRVPPGHVPPGHVPPGHVPPGPDHSGHARTRAEYRPRGR